MTHISSYVWTWGSCSLCFKAHLGQSSLRTLPFPCCTNFFFLYIVQKFLFLLTVSSGRKTVTHAALGTTQQRTAGLTENTEENSAVNTLKATARNQPLLSVDADMSNQSLSQGPKKQISGFVPGKNRICFNKHFSLKKGSVLHLKFVFWCLAKRKKIQMVINTKETCNNEVLRRFWFIIVKFVLY